MYAFGLCIDQHYLVPGLAALCGLADGLTPAARRSAAVRVLTLDLTRTQALLFSELASEGLRLLRHSPLHPAADLADG